MLLRLQEYDMVIKNRPSKEMLLADGLSRLPNKKKQKNKEVIDLDVRVNFVQFLTEKLTQTRQATNADPILCELRVRILQGWPESRRELHKDLQPCWSYRYELSIENGILLKGDRIRKSMQTETLEKIHYGHRGSNKYKLREKTCVFWSGINSNIDKIEQQCAICQELQKSQSAESLMPYKIPVRPWQIVATDIFNLNRHNYLLVMDYYSKYPFIRKLREFSSKEVIGIIKQIKSLLNKESRKGLSATMDPTLVLSSLKNLLKDGIFSTSPLLRNPPTNQTAWQNGAHRPSREPWRSSY